MMYLTPPHPSELPPDMPAWDGDDANFNFALEKYAVEELDIAKEYFLFWRTTPTLISPSCSEPVKPLAARLSICAMASPPEGSSTR